MLSRWSWWVRFWRTCNPSSGSCARPWRETWRSAPALSPSRACTRLGLKGRSFYECCKPCHVIKSPGSVVPSAIRLGGGGQTGLSQVNLSGLCMIHAFMDKFGATSFLNSASRSSPFASSTEPSLSSSLCSKGLAKANTTSLRIFHKVLMSALACNFQLRNFDRYVIKLLFCVFCSLQRIKPNGLSPPPEVHQQWEQAVEHL